MPGALSNFCSDPPDHLPGAGWSFDQQCAGPFVQLGWTEQTNHNNWEIEVQVNDGSPFTGTPNYFSNQNNLTITGLLADTRYKFQIRAQCGFFGQSFWSGTGNFVTLLDCNADAPLVCGQERTLYSRPEKVLWEVYRSVRVIYSEKNK